MSSNYYKIYLDSVIQLAQTLVIKSEDSIALQNKQLVMLYGPNEVDPFNPQTWKYYLNISGEYHPLDTPMMVVSMDTLEEIVFNKDNLRIHRATARAYAFGTRNYRELINRYPTQESLIYGIIAPVDINQAIAAEDGDILGWPDSLVEPNEYSLISKLQTWIKSYKLKCENKQYAISDNLYLPVSAAVMYLMLVPAILTFRQEACKTNEAHSYHVREYLASHNGLDKYLDFMTLKQSLFLYRNVKYFQRNAGNQETFQTLIDNFLTARYIPLGEYTMRHILTDMPGNSIVPSIMFRKKALNLGINSTAYDLLTMEEFYNKEQPMAPGNLDYQPEYEQDANIALTNSPSNVVLTKAVESTVIDYSDSTPYKLLDTLMANWLHQSMIGLYRAVIMCVNPKTGEQYALRANEAIILLWYVYYKAMGLTKLTAIPPMLARRVIRPNVGLADMLKVVPSEWQAYLKPTLQQAIDMLPVMTGSISIDAFYNLTYQIYTGINNQRMLWSQENHQDVHAYLYNAISVLFMDKVYTHDPNETYQTWLADRNIAIEDLNQVQYETMYQDLVNEGTGMSINTKTSIRDVQQAMLGLMADLSSYSIQFMSTMNSDAIWSMDMNQLRIGDRRTKVASHFEVEESRQGIVDAHDYVSAKIELDLEQEMIEYHAHQYIEDHIDVDNGIFFGGDGHLEQSFVLDTSINFYVDMNPIPDDNGVINAPGMDLFEALSKEERFKLKDSWAAQQPAV